MTARPWSGRAIGEHLEVPRYVELINPSLEALHQLGGSASIEELVDKVVDVLQPPKEVLEHGHGDGRQTELEYQLAWARTYLKKYGLVTNSARGIWSLTPKGMSVKRVDVSDVLRAVRSDRRPRRPRATPAPPPELPGETTETTAGWREVLTRTLLEIQPAAFERLCQRMLREAGFIEVEVTGRSGDGGIDGHGIIRVAGLISFPVMFQCKRYRDNLGPSAVRDFRGAMMGRADKGLLISTGGFTREARAEATRDGAPPIDLIDGNLLADKLKELGLGIRAKMVEAVEVDVGWFGSL